MAMSAYSKFITNTAWLLCHFGHFSCGASLNNHCGDYNYASCSMTLSGNGPQPVYCNPHVLSKVYSPADCKAATTLPSATPLPLATAALPAQCLELIILAGIYPAAISSSVKSSVSINGASATTPAMSEKSLDKECWKMSHRVFSVVYRK